MKNVSVLRSFFRPQRRRSRGGLRGAGLSSGGTVGVGTLVSGNHLIRATFRYTFCSENHGSHPPASKNDKITTRPVTCADKSIEYILALPSSDIPALIAKVLLFEHSATSAPSTDNSTKMVSV